MNDLPTIAYKILTGPQMAELEDEGRFKGAPIDLADGYIHLSTLAQLTETVDKHFAGQTDLRVVSVNLEMLGGAVQWEPSRGGQLFPHVYTDLPLSAAIAYGLLKRDPEGNVLPPVQID